MTTGEKIRAARKMAGMTQKALAHELKLSYQGIAQWENDLRNPKQETLQKLAAALGVPVVDLMDDDIISRILAETNTDVVKALGGDVEKIIAFQEAVDNDAMMESSVRQYLIEHPYVVPKEVVKHILFGKSDVSDDTYETVLSYAKFLISTKTPLDPKE